MSTKYGGEEIDAWPADESPLTCAGICVFSHRREDLLKHEHPEGCVHWVCAACLRLHVLAGPHLRLEGCRKKETPFVEASLTAHVQSSPPFGGEPC